MTGYPFLLGQGLYDWLPNFPLGQGLIIINCTIDSRKSIKISKGQSEAINQRTDNTMATKI